MVSLALLTESKAVIFMFCFSTFNIGIVYSQSTSRTWSNVENNSRTSPYKNLSFNGTVRHLSLGESAKYTCQITNRSIVWIINSTYYNVNLLPNDYGYYFNKSNLIFFIPMIKLWMNNTKYGCYNHQDKKLVWFAHVIVNVDFSGPYDTTLAERQFFFVPCHMPSMSTFNVYTVWRINGTLYNERFLPPPFYQKQNGLLVRPLDRTIGKTTLQCLLLSDVLLRDHFYYSDVGSVKVDKDLIASGGPFCSPNDPFCATSLSRLKFHFNNFYFSFSKNSYKISWSAANTQLCSSPFNYSLVRTGSSQHYSMNLGDITSHVLRRRDLFQGNNHPNYQIHIEAEQFYMRNFTTCSYSNTFLDISPQVSVIKKHVNISDNLCLHDYPNSGVIWPYLNSNESCLCDSIFHLGSCSCVSSTGYTVGVSGRSLCWYNLTTEMNNSIIIFYNGVARRTSIQPSFGTKILKMYQIVLTVSGTATESVTVSTSSSFGTQVVQELSTIDISLITIGIFVIFIIVAIFIVVSLCWWKRNKSDRTILENFDAVNGNSTEQHSIGSHSSSIKTEASLV